MLDDGAGKSGEEVTMPNEEPAPRRAQKMSWFWVVEAVMKELFARTTLASIMESKVRPWVWEEGPNPPWRAWPPIRTLGRMLMNV
jgi:hypothetical protein